MQVAVLAFGHVNFKAACVAEGVDWQQARHLSNLGMFRGLVPSRTRMIIHQTAYDHRQRDILNEAKRLGFASPA